MNDTSKIELQLGAATSVFGHRDALTADKIKTLASAGLKWIEIAALQEQHVSVFDQPHLDELVAAVEQSPAKVWSMHSPFCGFAMDDADTRDKAVRRMIYAGHAAAKFGARYLVVHPGRDVPIVDRERELGWCTEALQKAIEQIPSSVSIALETMGKDGLACPPDELMGVMKKLDPTRSGICFDCGHVNLGYDVVEYIKIVGKRIVTTHLHDNDSTKDAHAMPGEGTIDYPGMIKALLDVGYDGVWMCEFGTQDLGPAGTVKEFARLMNGYANS